MLRHPHQLRGELVQGLAHKRGIQKSGEQLQLRLAQLCRESEELVLHHAAVRHHHGDEGGLVHQDQIKPPDGEPPGPLGEGEGGVVGELGHHASRLVDHLVQLPHFQVQRLVDLLCLLQAQPLLLHQLVDVQPVALGGGNPPGGGVGLLQIAQLRQLGQLVADGGGGDLYARQLRQRLGAHRLRRLDVAFHHGAQNFLLSLGQLQWAASFPEV